MPAIPAFCSNCNSFFTDTSLISGNFTVKITNSYVTCPFCHAPANIIDGTYTSHIINVILKSGINNSDFKKFSQIVEENKKNPASIEEISEAIKSEIPKLSPLTVFLKHDIGLITVLSFMLSVLTSYIALMTYLNSEQITKEKVTQEMLKPTATPKTMLKQKARVNEPCICGSGRKYKKCCQPKDK